MKGIERGIISRIYLENFVTYDNVVIRPGRNLNLIIGPNGTGKSTIVCAIVLGLGGNPKVIGRALHVGEYVKTGCKQAKIEIDLTDIDNSNIVVTRIFTAENHTSWMINRKTATLKEIVALTESLNIQVDNLCQFLPQDKVQDFSKMNPQELLENTERSVGEPVLFEYHTKLMTYRARFQELETQITNKTTLLGNQTQKYEGLKEIVSSIKEKKVIKKKITSLKQKKAWILYDIMRNDLLKVKEGRDAALAEMKSLDEKLKPMNNIIQKLKSDIRTLQHSANEYNDKVYAKTSKVKRLLDEIRTNEDNIKDIENTCKHRIQAEQNRDQEIAIVQQQKSKLNNDLHLMINEVGSVESLMEEQQRISVFIENQRRVVNELMNQKTTFKQQEGLIRHEIEVQEIELRAARDVEAKRLELLRRRSPDAYKGVLWLRENTDKFRATVHEPMLLKINVQSAKYSMYLESIIPVRDLIAFVCEDKQDMNLLLKYLRDQQKFQVNAVHSDPNKNISMHARIPIENIRQFGFQHYLSSLVDAPPTIMKYLVSMYRLNNIPIGSNAVEDSVDHIPHSLTCFYSQNKVFSVNMSKYTGTKSTRISRVHGNGTLSIILDTTKLHGIAEKLKSLNAKLEYTLKDIEQTNKKLCQGNQEVEECRSVRNQTQHNIQQIKALRSRIQIAESKIEDLQNDRVSIEQIRATYNEEIQVVIKNQLQEYKKYNVLLEECFKSISIYEQVKLELKLHQQTLVTKQNDSQELRDKCVIAEQTFKKLDDDLQPIRAELKRMFDEALEITDGIGPQDKAFQSFNNIFAKLPSSIEEIDDELKVAQAKVFCLGKNSDGENVLRDYEKVKADVEDLKQEIESRMTELRVIARKTDELRDKWLPPLEKLIERINKNFSSYFSSIKCAGEVSLTHGENPMDFEQYGLKIKVKFRDADELQELTRHHQSGGERAVATAIYMIALQELSRVPFRCVDEINQGMDAINERRIFELIVKITGKSDSSQYFLLTPKLLPALLYAETVTVHCVFNGPFMISHNEYETSRYCEQIMDTIEEDTSDET